MGAVSSDSALFFIFFIKNILKKLHNYKNCIIFVSTNRNYSLKKTTVMTIETQLEIENNAGNIVTLEIVAEYEPFQRAQTGAYGMPTECDSEEICDITTVNGQDDEQLFNAEFDVAYNYKEFYGKLTQAVREQFDREFYAYSC